MDIVQTPIVRTGGTIPTAASAGSMFRFCEIAAPDFDTLTARCHASAASGFDAMLLPCPYSTHGGLLWDAAIAAECYGGGPIGTAAPAIAALRRALAITMIVDLPVDGVAAGSPLHHARVDYFEPPDEAGILDPRQVLELERAAPRLTTDAEISHYATLLSDAAASFASAGLDGVRLVDIKRLPPAIVARVVGEIRARTPGLLLIGDTTGVSWDHLSEMQAGLFDRTVASSAYWNWSDAWFFEELAHLRRIAPPLVPVPLVEASGEAAADALASFKRGLGLALSVGSGWIVGDDQLASEPFAQTAAAFNAAFDVSPGADAITGGQGVAVLGGAHARVLAILRTAEPDARASKSAYLTLLNTDIARAAIVDPAVFLPAGQGMFTQFEALDPGSETTLVAGRRLSIAAGETQVFKAVRSEPALLAALSAAETTATANRLPRLALEDPQPAVDGGAFAVKRVAGEIVAVSIDIIGDGHDKLAAAVQWQAPGRKGWSEARLTLVGNDRWAGSFPLETVGLHRYRVATWRDEFATFRDELAKKYNAGVPIALELREGAALVARTLGSVSEARATIEGLGVDDEEQRRTLLLSDELNALMIAHDERPHLAMSAEIPVDAERSGAAFASWYEVFPRSMADDPSRHGTFRDVERHLPRIKAMGFDVLYFPPIHPIGRVNRKGPNNTLTPSDTDPGSPYAIGSDEGGHEDIHPELGGFEDFRHLLDEAAANGLEIALDFAIQCAPDHPWLAAHKGWFTWRPDGTVKYAENPPKKYQDIVNVDFYAADAVPGLWIALAESVMFWCDKGVRLFRVDNPHTKAFPFWEWMIREVRLRYPDVAFLAEAFTRPKIMQRLAKVGFSQSYTYFTWRNTKAEITAYMTELAGGRMREYFRPHFFVNTPDINPSFLHHAGRAGFLIRAALASTLSGLWGVYNGFELCEATPLAEGKEEYLDSEKFQIRTWDWDRPGNITAEITRLNAIRRANTALHSHLGISFLDAPNEAIVWFERANGDRSNVLLIGVSLDPFAPQTSALEIPLWRFGLHDNASIGIDDLVSGQHFEITGKYQNVTFTPEQPYIIWRLPSA